MGSLPDFKIHGWMDGWMDIFTNSCQPVIVLLEPSFSPVLFSGSFFGETVIY